MKTLFFIAFFLTIIVSCGGDDITDNDNENSDSDENSFVFPWKDDETGLVWSEKTPYGGKRYKDASSFCYRMKENDGVEWRVPTISELRTLIVNCNKTQSGGSCKVKDSCDNISCINDACSGCENIGDGRYSKLGDTGWYWSSTRSGRENGGYFFVGFSAGYINETSDEDFLLVRCVRNQ